MGKGKAQKAFNKHDTHQKAKPKPKAKPSKPSATDPAPAPVEAPAPAPTPVLPFPLQQRVLSVFNRAFTPVIESEAFSALLQEIKEALYARDFDAAFTNARPESLDAYAARWSPTRALGYASVLLGVEEHLADIQRDVEAVAAPEDEAERSGAVSEETDKIPEKTTRDAAAEKSIKLVSIGGGAAEVAALAAYLVRNPTVSGTLTLLDSAPWTSVVTKIHDSLTTPPPISQYASAAAKASNAALVPSSRLTPTFTQQDVLTLTRDQLRQTLGEEALLVTLLFTLNELYTSAGIGKTTAFLLNLTATIPDGSLLLVVDSPGSYSEAAVGKESKKYPMQWMLDHTILKKDPVEGCLWEKVESHDSVWFRLDDALHYPISLENMRYQMHLYRATRP